MSEAGEPISGATVALFAPGPTSPVAAVHSNAQGMFEIASAPGGYRLSITHGDWAAVLRQVEIASDKWLELGDIKLAAGGNPFTGTIRWLGSAPPPVVAFWTVVFGKEGFATLPEANGEIRVRLPEHSYLSITHSETIRSASTWATTGIPFQLDAAEVAAMTVPPQESALAEVRRAAIPISLDPNSEPSAELVRMLQKHPGRIFGLGESNHGGHEFLTVRDLLTSALARRGPVVVALEANWSFVLAVEDYVRGGKGDPDQLALGLRFWMWKTKGLSALLRRFRELNQARRADIHFTGIDMQFPTTNLDALQACFDSPLLRSKKSALLEALAWIRNENASPNRQQASAARVVLQDAMPEAGRYQLPMKRCSKPFVRAAMLTLIQYIDMVEGDSWFEENYRRDAAMAQNAIELAAGTGQTIVIWAHNLHIARKGIDGAVPMGGLLSHRKDISYVAVGTTIRAGQFLARIQSDNRVLGHATLPAAPESHLAHWLGTLGLPAFVIDLAGLEPRGEAKAWFSRAHLGWEVGAIFHGVENSDSLRVPADNFDMLVYIDQLTPPERLAEPDQK